MPVVVHLGRDLTERPTLAQVDGVSLRHYAGAADIELWLALRDRAFAREKIGVGRWNAADFAREFLNKSWWDPQRMWFAEPQGTLLPVAPAAVGTVTLALRKSGEGAQAVIHWLAVLPGWRRRGVARLLITALEVACWDAGHRRVLLETHAGWTSALRCYHALGYEPVTL